MTLDPSDRKQKNLAMYSEDSKPSRSFCAIRPMLNPGSHEKTVASPDQVTRLTSGVAVFGGLPHCLELVNLETMIRERDTYFTLGDKQTFLKARIHQQSLWGRWGFREHKCNYQQRTSLNWISMASYVSVSCLSSFSPSRRIFCCTAFHLCCCRLV